MINLELSKKHQETYEQTMMLAEHMMRPFSRKYDKEEHAYPKEMEQVAELIGARTEEITSSTRSSMSSCFSAVITIAVPSRPSRRRWR